MRGALFYVRSAVEFEEYRFHLKSVSCPHCRAVGNLNRHGYLRGYVEEGSERIVRGWRIFCSNRDRRDGCGRTHSVLLAGCLRRRMVRATRLWEFLGRMLEGFNPKAAWEKVRSRFSSECGAHLWRAWRLGQVRLRSMLSRMISPRPSIQQDPLLEVMEHLCRAFTGTECPVASFQIHFQQEFLRSESDAPD